VILNRDGHRLMLSKTHEPGMGVHANRGAKEASCDAYLWVTRVDALFARTEATGGEFVEPLSMRPYGVREFLVRDRDGRVITLGELQPASTS